jgi:hypothetical protein
VIDQELRDRIGAVLDDYRDGLLDSREEAVDIIAEIFGPQFVPIPVMDRPPDA